MGLDPWISRTGEIIEDVLYVHEFWDGVGQVFRTPANAKELTSFSFWAFGGDSEVGPRANGLAYLFAVDSVSGSRGEPLWSSAFNFTVNGYDQATFSLPRIPVTGNSYYVWFMTGGPPGPPRSLPYAAGYWMHIGATTPALFGQAFGGGGPRFEYTSDGVYTGWTLPLGNQFVVDPLANDHLLWEAQVTVTPEPGTVMLLASGLLVLVALAAARRREPHPIQEAAEGRNQA